MITMLQHIAKHFREKELDGAQADIQIVIRCREATSGGAADAAPDADRAKVESSSTAAAVAAAAVAAGAGDEDPPAFMELDSFPGHRLIINHSDYFRAPLVSLPELHIRRSVKGHAHTAAAVDRTPAAINSN
jgi:hypothetical protein